MIKILRGRVGSDLTSSGNYITLSDTREKELVERGIAEYGEPEPEPESEFLTEPEIRALKKKEDLLNYALKIRMEPLEKGMKVTDMQDAILNYQEELEA